ncbi:CoA transferase [Trebonia sp.]|uniref:CaiB/BaiF CoA transferase family protein n=1 Tax=Trebonia sp. TaxID=2767075 RepID=UPI00262B62DF|nr:CoA transferase [Trebonia sp.]
MTAEAPAPPPPPAPPAPPAPPPPLDGFRVLDFTRFLAGPYCTMVLADLGADVIKLEQPGSGDDSRVFGPFLHGESYSFAQVNRGKRSVCLDLRQPRGRALALDLALRADLVIESFRPGVAARLGLDYAAVSGRRQDILYCSISGFGQTGPYRDRPGFDIMAQGVTGLMRMTGPPGGRPAKVGFAVNDIAAGVTAVYSILAAQLVRERTGVGQFIDIALVDALLPWTVWEAGVLFGRGDAPAQTGTRHRMSAPYQAYRTADGYVTIGAGTDRLWRRTADALGCPQWCADPRFADNDARLAHIEALEAEIEAVTTTRTTAQWIAILDAAGVPCGPVLSYDQVFADPQVLAREMVAEMDHPIMGTIKVLGQPAKFSRSRARAGRPAPWLGQHSREVLAELGLDSAEIGALEQAGTTYDAHPGVA